HVVGGLHDGERPEPRGRREPEHLAQERRRSLRIAGMDDVVVQRGAHPPIMGSALLRHKGGRLTPAGEGNEVGTLPTRGDPWCEPALRTPRPPGPTSPPAPTRPAPAAGTAPRSASRSCSGGSRSGWGPPRWPRPSGWPALRGSGA